MTMSMGDGEDDRPRHWLLDPILWLIIVALVLVGTIEGERGRTSDVDERLYLTTLERMQEGDGYYEASAAAIREKDGAGPSQVRSLRTPLLAVALHWFPAWAWRWLATIPAAALCLAASALAGPDQRARQLAALLAGVWMLTSLPLLYLHNELWGAALFAFGALELRAGRDGRAALLCLLATAVRELFGLSLLVGLVVRRDRRPWVVALGVCAAGGALHAWLAQDVLDPNGYDPPLRALESYLIYVSPGQGAFGHVLGVALLVAAAAGLWLRRELADQRFLMLVAVPLVVGTAMSGRVYWSLTWCAVTSAAAAVTIVALHARAADAIRTRSGAG